MSIVSRSQWRCLRSQHSGSFTGWMLRRSIQRHGLTVSERPNRYLTRCVTVMGQDFLARGFAFPAGGFALTAGAVLAAAESP